MGQFLPVFVFEIAQAANMVILGVGEIGPVLLSSDQIADLPDWITEQVPDPIVCRSADELAILMIRGYDVWRGYRDQIMGR